MSDAQQPLTIIHTPVGRTQEELPVGVALTTAARTITETDLVNFVNGAGFVESLFLDAREQTVAGGGRLVPAVLTLALAEGLVIQSGVFHGTAIALLGLDVRIERPVAVSDTIYVRMVVTESRPTSTPGRGLVKTSNDVVNQDDEVVLRYEPARLIARGSDG